MTSCLYRGWVQHTRFAPTAHTFRYSTYFVCLDLTRLDQALPAGRLWSIERPAVINFRRRDHAGDARQPLVETIRSLVAQSGREHADGKILLLTQFRQFGYVFNPLSIYYCFDRTDRWVATVAEVRNTPWGEMFCYVLDGVDTCGQAAGEPRELKFCTNKEFHVSPFMGMNMQYRWQVSPPEDTLSVKIENVQGDFRLFQAIMKLQRQPMTSSSLLRIMLRFSASSHRTMAAIYWQAFRLWSKGLPYYPHPKNLQPQKGAQPTLHDKSCRD